MEKVWIAGFAKYISSMGLEAYKTLTTAFQILLTMSDSVASCVRSFSKMKLTKSYLQCHKKDYAVHSVENEVGASINSVVAPKPFAAIKARKILFGVW